MKLTEDYNNLVKNYNELLNLISNSNDIDKEVKVELLLKYKPVKKYALALNDA